MAEEMPLARAMEAINETEFRRRNIFTALGMGLIDSQVAARLLGELEETTEANDWTGMLA